MGTGSTGGAWWRRKRRSGQWLIGVVGNPSLCPAFWVRRGSDRENGFTASRARRATRPTPERISAPMWAWRRLQQIGECAGASLAVRFAPRSPFSLPLVRKSRGTRSGVGRGRRQESRDTAGERGARSKAPPTRAVLWQDLHHKLKRASGRSSKRKRQVDLLRKSREFPYEQ